MRILEAAWSRALPGRQVAERNALLRALKTVSLAALFPASSTTVISPQAKEAILSFVDQFVPPGSEVWLTGSRAKGSALPHSDWDVVAFHPAAPKRPEDLFKANQLGPHPLGGEIELVIAHPKHWNDPRRYMSDLRTYGIKLR